MKLVIWDLTTEEILSQCSKKHRRFKQIGKRLTYRCFGRKVWIHILICQMQIVSINDFVQVLKTPIKLAKSSSLSRQNNSVNIAEGQRIRVNGGHVLTVMAHGVEVSGGDNPYDTQSYVKAQRMADALASMLRNAGGTMTTVAHSKEEYARYTEGITDVMSYLGVDTSKDFTVNGMKYSKNKDGWYESEANSDAQAAYEQLKANNRTYQFADEKTKKQIAYISDSLPFTAPPKRVRAGGKKHCYQKGRRVKG